MADEQRAVFPLSSVLFPGATLQLMIFEPRYLDMVSHCLSTQQPFIICQLTSGQEVGKAAPFEAIGTFAHIVDFDQGEEGVLMITVVGGSRVCVLEHTVNQDQLTLTQDYRVLPDVEDSLIPPETAPLKELLLKLAKLPDIGIEVDPEQLDSAEFVVNQLAQILPLETDFKQYLLEESDSFEKCLELYEQLLTDSMYDE
ncbi:LON peptidase substrate-binding domain-containing protein [Pleionea mediterranea]|uniref:Lon N-terminal domain-containing protein n=1 Tax=Pleionea mediterranea TaxID=523701 RepID=A0A316FT41_9GAMM|nr:LON peptidase substrate-binding domain-containing protein [Pleionea mediterranea]PWK50780.1 hypothetical protein C8D97_10667 [Pleionea mediterranea]